MKSRKIVRAAGLDPRAAAGYTGAAMAWTDGFGRVVRDVRISVTDRCNLRCVYCMPVEPHWLPRAEILTFEEIERLARIFVAHGVTAFRITGGEPLVRRGIVDLVARIAAIPGVSDLAITTNGLLLERLAAPLRAAGLRRVTVSLDTLDGEKYRHIARGDGFERALRGIEAAQRAGFDPVKVNTVVVRGFNEEEIPRLARAARERGWHLRFIEFMPLDGDRQWGPERVVSAREIRERLREVGELVLLDSSVPEPARVYRYADGRGEVGIIASVTEPFCASCDRVRVTADGKFRTCLFATKETDLRGPLRSGASDEQIAAILAEAIRGKEAGHRIGREDFQRPGRAMYAIGG